MMEITCATCGMRARFSPAPEGRSVTQFDSAEFRAECKTARDSKTYDCPDLADAILAAQ